MELILISRYCREKRILPILIGMFMGEILALAGSIFAGQPECKRIFSDSYHLLYGHHMDSGNMFGDLDLYKKKAFFQKK